MNRPAIYVLILLFFALSLFGEVREEEVVPSTEQGRECQEKPAFQTVRYAEDWSSYKCAEGRDRLKHLSFGGPDSYLSLGGQFRLRGESWSDFAFGESDRFDDSFGLLRARFHADLWPDSVRVFVEAKSALANSRNLPGG